MNQMQDDQFDATLRRFLISESERIASTALSEFEMADRLNVRAPVSWDRRLILLLAAALLMAGLVGAAILGSDLLRTPAEIDHWMPRLTAAGTCPSGLAEEIVMFATADAGLANITLYTDGQLLSKPLSGAPTVRRLSASGIQRVSERAADVAIDGNCRTVFTEGPYRFLYVVTSDGFFNVTWGSESQGLHATTSEEKAAVVALSNWLDDMDGWLRPEDWADSTPRPYVAESWSVDIQRVFGGDGDPAGPDPADFVFPDGTTLSTFGVQLPIFDPDPMATIRRCGNVTAAAAAEISAALDATVAPNPEASEGWVFSEDGGSGHDVIVQMSPLDPYSMGCLEMLDQPSLAPSASPDPLAGADPCSILTDAQVAEVLHSAAAGEAHLSALPAGMRDCVYFSGGPLTISLRQLTTSPDEASELALEIFGRDYVESVVDGARVYGNGCADASESCQPAIAVSSGPYFVVLWRADPRVGTPEEALEALMQLVVDSLATR